MTSEYSSLIMAYVREISSLIGGENRVNPFKYYRKEANLSQKSASIALRVERSTVTKWETGKSLPNAALLPDIARLYKCSIGDLLGEKKAG